MTRMSEFPGSEVLTVLVVGGTTEGRALADALADRPGFRVVSSLAGRTASPRLPVGEVHVGGFGGAGGLADFVRHERIAAIVDATHPFAVTIGRHVAEAGRRTGVPVLRLERPAWEPVPGDRWTEVDDWETAAAIVAARARRVLLAVGRQEIAAFAHLDRAWFLVRTIEAPDPMPPFRHAELLLARGPFTRAAERGLLAAHRIDTVVCKNSGGEAMAAKLAAARDLGLAVVMRRRPVRPDLPTVERLEAAVAWLADIATA